MDTIIDLDMLQVSRALPHECPALLIDSATVTMNQGDETGSIKASYYINPSYPILAGHFPGNPIFRGVDLIESMAQACIILSQYMFPAPESIPLFEGIKDAAFIHKAKPNDEITIYAKFISKCDASNRFLQKTVFCFEAEARKKGKLLASATILGALASSKRKETG